MAASSSRGFATLDVLLRSPDASLSWTTSADRLIGGRGQFSQLVSCPCCNQSAFVLKIHCVWSVPRLKMKPRLGRHIQETSGDSEGRSRGKGTTLSGQRQTCSRFGNLALFFRRVAGKQHRARSTESAGREWVNARSLYHRTCR